MFLFRHLFRRVPLNTTTRQIFGIERCKNVTKLKLFNYSSDASSTIKSAIFSRKNNLTKDLEKFQKKIIKYRQTSIRDIDRVLNLIRNNGSFDERLAYALLKCCGNVIPTELPKRRTEQAKKIWSMMIEMNMKPNIHHYNALLHIYLENEHRFAWPEMMEKIRAQELTPNERTYGLMFEQLCRMGNMDEAIRFIDEIKANGFELSENIFCSKMLGYACIDDMISAAAIPNEMRSHGVVQTVITTVALMRCYARNGDIDTIIDIFDSHAVENGPIETEDMLEVIFDLCLNGHENKIDSLVQRMQRSKGYHQLIHHTITTLIARGKFDGAYTLLKTMPRATLANGQLIEVGDFFLKLMIKFEHSVESIIGISRRITADGLNSRAIHVVLKHALSQGMVDVSIAALNELRQLREPIRQHYFWPLLYSEGTKGKENLFKIIRLMHDEFQLMPDAQTVADFIFPHLKKQSADQTIEELTHMGIPETNIVPLAVLHCLQQFDLEKACEIATAHDSIYYPAKSLQKPLTHALRLTRNFELFVRLVRIIHDALPLNNESSDDQANEASTLREKQLDFVGSIIYDAISIFRDFHTNDLILRYFLRENLKMSAKHGQRVKTFFLNVDIHWPIVQFEYLEILVDSVSRKSYARPKQTYSHVEHKTKRITDLMKAIECNDYERAIYVWKNLKSDEVLNEHNMQQFVNCLQKNGRFDETHEAVKQAVINKIRLSNQTLRNALYRLASRGDLAKLDEFKLIADDSTIVPIPILSNAYCLVYTVLRKGKEYIDHLVNLLNWAEKPADLDHFPLNSAITILSKQPELLDAYKSMVEKYLEKNCTAPLNALWMYYFIIGYNAECKEIWTNTLSMVPEFSFYWILNIASTNNDAQLLNRLLSFFRAIKMDKANMVIAYNELLEIQFSTRAFEEAKTTIEYTVWDDCYEQINPRFIRKIADEMKTKGQKFPYKIPKCTESR